jgi:hypothetical protein
MAEALPYCFTLLCSTIPWLISGSDNKIEWLNDWDGKICIPFYVFLFSISSFTSKPSCSAHHFFSICLDGVNYSGNPTMALAWNAGLAKNSTMAVEAMKEVWLSEHGVVLGVWEPVAMTIKLWFTVFMSAALSYNSVKSDNSSHNLEEGLVNGMPPLYLGALSVCFHSVNSVLLHGVLLKIMLAMMPPAAVSNSSNSTLRTMSWSASMGALLWSLHPLRSEVIGW